MNKETYKTIAHAKTVAEQIQRTLQVDVKINSLIDLQQDAENDCYDKSDAWQDSERGQEEIARVEQLSDVVGNFESIREELRSLINTIEEIENDAPEGVFD